MSPESSQATAKTDSRRVPSSYPEYAFLVHSQTSLIENLPPKIDTGMLARQKRRRTSPEDHAILEAAYQENSKPDKAERTKIVSRVALGEKEVQIWFQNRRQNDRRKSRPLLPHELAPHLRNSYPPDLFSSPLSTNREGICSSSPPANLVSYHRPLSSTSPREEQTPSRASTSSIHDLLNPTSAAETHVSPSLTSPSFTDKGSPEMSQSLFITTDAISDHASDASEGRLKHNETEKSEKRNVKLSPCGTKRSHEDIDAPDKSHTTACSPTIPTLQSHGSNVRLSISMDGAVKVKTTDEDTPSPPKQRPASALGVLQRSQSAVDPGPISKEGLENETRTKPLSSTFGRSRDTRTWEFYCDSDARDALSSHAERERNGSAVGALNLIRSQSQKAKAKENEWQKRKAMTPRIGAGNTGKVQPSRAGEKPKLSRAMSSMGRLQSSDVIKTSMKSTRPSLHVRFPSGDSDKENWAPGTRSSNNPLRRQPADPGSARSPLQLHILEDNNQIPTTADLALHDNNTTSAALSSNTSSKEKLVDVDDKENDGGDRSQNGNRDEDNTDVEALMKDRENKEEDDLDCIQGLLSLSKGAWR